jgi:hypothetical protein
MSELFKEGGPYKIRRVGPDKHTMSISVPPDEDGRVARECVDDRCSPGYFKVKLGTGLKDQKEAFCPYCRKGAPPADFLTKEQKRYAYDVFKREAILAVGDHMRESLGLSHDNRRRLASGLISVDIEMKPPSPPPVRRPYEDILKRDLVCPHCGLDHSVYGFAFWCPDCGRDIFTTHVQAEIAMVVAMLGDVERRREVLGSRVAAADVDNALEDLVSIFEATLKIEIRRSCRCRGMDEEKIAEVLGGIGSRLQNVANAEELVPKSCEGVLLYDGDVAVTDRLRRVFQKRHPITHNLGVIDKKYLERVRAGGEEGTEVRVTKSEVEETARDVFAVLSSLHDRLRVRLGLNRDGQSPVIPPTA